jgi:8-oxo-dGTP pyrophosphatase MutT (NUDIX family)
MVLFDDSGDGFITVADGSQRWGRFGAAGVLARHRHRDGQSWYFVARRSRHCHQGGTWAIPGGALHRGEEPLQGALREFEEEIGLAPPVVRVEAVVEDDHGGWSYWTHVVEVAERFDAGLPVSWETAEARWVPAAQLGDLELFGAFRSTLQRLQIL